MSIEPLPLPGPVRRLSFVNHPAGAETSPTQGDVPIRAPVTTKLQSPSASDTQVAVGVVSAWPANSPSVTPGSPATVASSTRSPPTRTVTTASPGPGDGTAAEAGAVETRPVTTRAVRMTALVAAVCENRRMSSTLLHLSAAI